MRFFLIVGPGGTGKSTFQETLMFVWGSYGSGLDFNSLAAAKIEGAKARPDIAKLRGARLVFANESRAGLRLDEGIVKILTGGDTVTCRELYGKEFDFKPTFKLWLRTNTAPAFDGADSGMCRRIRRVPFDVICTEAHKDPKLSAKLRGEADGILLWALEGLKDYQANGLVEPTVVQAATKEYVESLDAVGLFIDERCELRGNYEQASGDLYTAYSQWAEMSGHLPMGDRRFYEQLKARGHVKVVHDGRKFWVGLRLRQR